MVIKRVSQGEDYARLEKLLNTRCETLESKVCERPEEHSPTNSSRRRRLDMAGPATPPQLVPVTPSSYTIYHTTLHVTKFKQSVET